MCVTPASAVSVSEYPGRGILLGVTRDGVKLVSINFIMGRSSNSRNRVYRAAGAGVRTEAFEPALLEDPSLIIYNSVSFLPGAVVVTNGDQTDTVTEFLKRGESFEQALLTRTFEPDAPNYTPRISGYISAETLKLSILKSVEGDFSAVCREFYEFVPERGRGYFIHTYSTEKDGRLLPFEGAPVRIEFAGTPEEIAREVWQNLHPSNKISLCVTALDISSGERETLIVNKNGGGDFERVRT